MREVSTTEGPETYVVAVADPPAIVCPPWCAVSEEQHRADLLKLEGFVHHMSDVRERVGQSAGSYPDGTPDPSSPPMVYVEGMTESIALDDAEQLARTILATVQGARS